MAKFHPSSSIPENFGLDVARGVTFGITGVHKFGRNPDVDSGTVPETVWPYGGVASWSSSAETWYVMSADASDTEVQVQVEGCGVSYTEVTQSVTLNGQTPVALGTAMLRVNSFRVTNGVQPLGTIYLSRTNSATAGVPNTATDVRGMIDPTHNTGLSTLYTIPAGYTGYVTKMSVEVSANDTEVTLRSRAQSGVWITRSATRIAAAGHGDIKWEVPLELPERTDIEVRVTVSTNSNNVVTADYDLFLVRA